VVSGVNLDGVKSFLSIREPM